MRPSIVLAALLLQAASAKLSFHNHDYDHEAHFVQVNVLTNLRQNKECSQCLQFLVFMSEDFHVGISSHDFVLHFHLSPTTDVCSVVMPCSIWEKRGVT
jgi:hypothetical protein